MAIGRDKTKDEQSGEIVAYSALAVRDNAGVVEYCRTSHFIQYQVSVFFTLLLVITEYGVRWYNDFEGIRKKEVVAHLRHYFDICLDGTTKVTKNLQTFVVYTSDSLQFEPTCCRHLLFLPILFALATDILFWLIKKRCRWKDNIKMDLQETRR